MCASKPIFKTSVRKEHKKKKKKEEEEEEEEEEVKKKKKKKKETTTTATISDNNNKRDSINGLSLNIKNWVGPRLKQNVRKTNPERLLFS